MSSSNAMSAKAKAMFGERLKKEDYQMLLNKKTIGEIATYLKNETYFKDVLKDINENSVHRGELESLIRQDTFARFSRLIRYGQVKDDGFYRYVVALNEIEQILSCIRSIKSEDNTYFVGKIPLFYEKLMQFDIRKLSACKNFNQLLDVLKNTKYEDILRPLLLDDIDKFDYVKCETALRNNYYHTMLNIVSSDKSIKCKKEIKALFEIQIELENINKIYRLKKYFNASSDEILNVITPIYSKIPEKQLSDFIINLDADAFLNALSNTFYGKYFAVDSDLFIENITKSIIYSLNKKNLTFTNNPDLILLSYMALTETEINNIIEIIEGVRYHVSTERISKLLIV